MAKPVKWQTVSGLKINLRLLSIFQLNRDEMIKVTKDNRDYRINYLEHIVHHHNLENILKHGLLPHKAAHEKGLISNDISLQDVQHRRSNKRIRVQDEKVIELHDYVPFYFNSRNPMLYRRRNIQHELLILCVSCNLINNKYCIFSDGNAASKGSSFYIGQSKLSEVDFELIFGQSWNHDDPVIKRKNVRKMCSEVLIYPDVKPSSFQKIICPNEQMAKFAVNKVRQFGTPCSHIKVEIQTGYFFM